jgi:hypothetical protein
MTRIPQGATPCSGPARSTRPKSGQLEPRKIGHKTAGERSGSQGKAAGCSHNGPGLEQRSQPGTGSLHAANPAWHRFLACCNASWDHPPLRQTGSEHLRKPMNPEGRPHAGCPTTERAIGQAAVHTTTGSRAEKARGSEWSSSSMSVKAQRMVTHPTHSFPYTSASSRRLETPNTCLSANNKADLPTGAEMKGLFWTPAFCHQHRPHRRT